MVRRLHRRDRRQRRSQTRREVEQMREGVERQTADPGAQHQRFVARFRARGAQLVAKSDEAHRWSRVEQET